MEKAKDKTQLQVVDDLCVRIRRSLSGARGYLDVIDVTEITRETAIVKTKIEEAQMWLEKYHERILDELSIIKHSRHGCTADHN